ncbi:MAG: hypothetical protein AAF430_00630 [Myxococcota bacterium]
MVQRLSIVLCLGWLACGPERGPFVVEANTPAVQGNYLSEAVGLELDAGEVAPILEVPCALPCAETVAFGTEDEEQIDILLYLYRGNAPSVDGNHSLGLFAVSGFSVKDGTDGAISITFRATESALLLEAKGSDGAFLAIEELDEEAVFAE